MSKLISFNSYRNKNLYIEMAAEYPDDISKVPVKIDAEDKDFLHQFPAEYWSQAHYQRYHDDLHDALAERNARRKQLYDGIYQEMLKKAQQEPNIANNPKLIEKRAKYLTGVELEKQIPHTNYPEQEKGLPEGYKRYKFRKRGRISASNPESGYVTIIAKPHINRLIHKLERAVGKEHHPESGLHDLGSTHGEYGYSLEDPRKGIGHLPNATRGMQMATDTQVSNAMSSWLNQNAHGMFGDLPKDVKWLPVEYGRTIYKDNWSVDKLFNPTMAKIYSTLNHLAAEGALDPNGDPITSARIDTNDKKRKLASWMATDQLIKMAEAGKLHGPPIPGVAEEGLPITVKTDKQGKKVLEPPKLYLPHEEKLVNQEDPDGRKYKKKTWVPIVNPGEYVRKLGSEEGDEELAKTNPELLRGYQKDYVKAANYKYGGNYLANSALHLGKNSIGQLALDESDPEYKHTLENLHQEMGRTSLNNRNKPVGREGPFFLDIIKGIWFGITTGAGGSTFYENEILREMVPDLHSLVYMSMIKKLRDPRFKNENGRQTFAKDITALQAQQDLGKGGGTRRKRKLTAAGREYSTDAGIQGDEGGEISSTDYIQSKMKGQSRSELQRQGREGSYKNYRPSDFGEDEYEDGKRGQGDKARGVGFKYRIENLNELIAQAEKDALSADQNKASAKASNNPETMSNAITDKVHALENIVNVLRAYYDDLEEKGKKVGNIEQLVADALTRYTANNPSTEEIVARFKKEFGNINKQIVASQTPDSNSAEQDAINRFNSVIAQIPPEMLRNPETKVKLQAYIDRNPLAKAAFDKLYGAKPLLQAAARPIQASIPLHSLSAQSIEQLRLEKAKWEKTLANPTSPGEANMAKIVLAKLNKSIAEKGG